MAQNEPIRQIRPNPDIPDKLYFRIGDVAKLCEVPTYVLRFWEVEFPQLKPNKGGTGQRLYRRRDVEMALRVKRLLYDEGYTIPGARQVLKQEQRSPAELQPAPQLALAIEAAPYPPVRDLRRLELLRKDLEDLHQLLSRPPAPARSTVQSIRSARGPRLAPPPASRPHSATMDDLFDPNPDSGLAPPIPIQDAGMTRQGTLNRPPSITAPVSKPHLVEGADSAVPSSASAATRLQPLSYAVANYSYSIGAESFLSPARGGRRRGPPLFATRIAAIAVSRTAIRTALKRLESEFLQRLAKSLLQSGKSLLTCSGARPSCLPNDETGRIARNVSPPVLFSFEP